MKKDPEPENDLRSRALELAYRFLIGNPLKRFFTAIFLGGITLIGGEGLLYLLTEYVLNEYGSMVRNSAKNLDEDANWLTVRNSGLVLCAIGIGLHLMLFGYEQWQASKKAQKDQKKLKAQLVGKLRDIAIGFADEGISRSAGYMIDDLREAKRLALELKPELPEAILSDPIFAVVADPKVDASATKPYLGVTATELQSFADRLANQ
ncbi:hypothetical protein [Ruegeria sp. HKCCA0235A]|uniref:hypothetical protein n=1 Tax=Ruegeria sp. HKCCA0235A TaxID=2682998 RepID=UPI00148908A6|nr:hypothetical protein [Ruegeria sp. HKCCA0235A]